MSEEENKRKCRWCENIALPNKGCCSDHKERSTCYQCQQEIWKKGVGIIIGDIYTRQERTAENRYLCWNCWEQEKDDWKEKFWNEECYVFGDYYHDNGQLFGNRYFFVCKICNNWAFESKFDETCSANCQRKYDSLSFQEKENLTKQSKNSNTNRSNNLQERERESKNDSGKDSKGLYIGLGLGAIALIAGLAYFFTRKKDTK